ncbi:uncharacterized protein LOC142177294 [Nicotiana tabacum]|uniref:Uncharacterized protein LOC142177294 n=1 Tax=Nicotiana tabacum TaxID=4097 RepID=A0AC58TXC9_TOBAC
MNGKLLADEPYYDSSDCDSFDSDKEPEPVSNDEGELGQLSGRRKSNKVNYDLTCKIVIWQLGLVFENVTEFRTTVTKYALKKGVELDKYVNEPTRVRVKCKGGCPWLIFAIKEGRSENFTVKTYNPKHKCHRKEINFLCNSKYLAVYLKDRIISQPTIKGWKIQDLIRKDLGKYVGKVVCLKTRKLVLQKAMGDHVAEFNRILEYRDVLLKSNPGSTCVVKLTDTVDGKKQFNSFYIFFDAMKKGFLQVVENVYVWMNAFLRLLIVVAKDENNQIFPVAWAVVTQEKKRHGDGFLRFFNKTFTWEMVHSSLSLVTCKRD